MVEKILPLPPRDLIKEHVYLSLSRYWKKSTSSLLALPVHESQIKAILGPLQLSEVMLPDWALDCGIEGKLLVPVEACDKNSDWQQVDWWMAVFLLLECWHERTWELNHEPIHSYSFQLKGWDKRAWEHAWVNRIALFLRVWAARNQNESADCLFGNLPKASVLMTHDVDAVCKTSAIRLKQGAFNLFNAGRYLVNLDIKKAFEKIKNATRFLFGYEDWNTFEYLLLQETQANVAAHFHFYADKRKKSLKRWLLDPYYDIRKVHVQKIIELIKIQRGIIGLHPTYDAWRDTNIINQQRQNLSDISGVSVTVCRQHWLQFSWKDTWQAQSEAGIELDTTLMFNDRSGFRSSAALCWNPFNQIAVKSHNLAELPTVMMDSHLYDYQRLSDEDRKASISHWLDEVHAVHGEIAVLWHPHTLTDDYGWKDGFLYLINKMKDKEICSGLH